MMILNLPKSDLVVLPGGFSYGDYLDVEVWLKIKNNEICFKLLQTLVVMLWVFVMVFKF